MKPNPWTEADHEYLRQNAGKLSHAAMAASLGRTVKAVNNRCKAIHAIGRRFWSREDLAYLREHAGKDSAAVIGAALGRTAQSVHVAMQTHGLARPKPSLGDGFEAFLREKHAIGWSDAEIADAWKCERHTVGDWRKRLHLASNALSEHRRRKVAQKTSEQLKKAGLKSLADVRSQAFRQFARDCGWPEDLRPRHVQILNALWKNGPMTRKELAAEIGLHWRGVHSTFFCNERRPGEPQGSYLSGLVRRGLVIDLGRTVYQGGQGKNVHAYSLPLNIQRGKVG